MKAYYWRRSVGVLTLASTFAVAQSNIQLPESSVEDYRVESQYGPEKGVLNPKFPLDSKLEIGGGFGYSSASTLMRYYAATGSVVYHLSQRHAVEPVWFSYTWADQSKFVKDQIAAKKPAQVSSLSVQLPRYFAAASYLFSPYYAKMHITERSVTHFDVYMGLGVGLVNEQKVFLDESKAESIVRPGLSLAVGMRFLLPPRWSLRLEMRDIIHQSESFGLSKTVNNVQLTASLNLFFSGFPSFE